MQRYVDLLYTVYIFPVETQYLQDIPLYVLKSNTLFML